MWARRQRSVRLSEIADEAVAGLRQRPARALLTCAGTAIGVGAAVATVGLTSTANNQVADTFNLLSATQVEVLAAAASSSDDRPTLPADAGRLLLKVRGTKSAGECTEQLVSASVSKLPPGENETDPTSSRLIAATPGLWDAVDASLGTGRFFDVALSHERVAVLGKEVAAKIGISDLRRPTPVFVNGVQFTAIGVLASTSRVSELLESVIVPAPTAHELFGAPEGSARLIAKTDLGAAETVADQAPVAIDPVHPEHFTASGPPTPRRLASQISSSLGSLLLALTGVSLLVAAVGIANATLVSVMERVPEIGLRRALGAQPRHIGAQFMIESAVLGTAGGVVGTVVGVAAVLSVAASRSWTAILPASTYLWAPGLGAVVGLLAGLYPSIRAAHVEPVEAFRR